MELVDLNALNQSNSLLQIAFNTSYTTSPALTLSPPPTHSLSYRDQYVPPPALLLLDEPTAACDASACEAVERAVIESGLAVLIITHDNAQAQRFTHKRLIMTALR